MGTGLRPADGRKGQPGGSFHAGHAGAGSLRGGRGALKRARRIILLGAKNLEEMEQSVSVAQATQDMLESKKDRLRPVSL